MPNCPPIDQQVTFLYTNDLAASADFYGRVLGLPLVLDQGSCQIFGVSGQAFLGVCQGGLGHPEPSGVIVTFVSANVDGWYAYLQSEGVAIEKPPTLNTQYNIYHLFVRDPSGYLVEIQHFLDPHWPRAAVVTG